MNWILFSAFVGISLTGLLLGVEGRKSYQGYQVLAVVPKTKQDVTFLRNLMINDVNIDFWSEPSKVGKEVTFMIAPKDFHRVQVLLREQGIYFDTTINNVEALLEPVWKDLDNRRNAKGGMVFDIEDFNTNEDINAYLLTLAGECREGLSCEVYSIGNSALGAPINVFKISKSGSGRKGYWIDSAIHAREWLAPATNLKILDNLARGGDADAVRLTDAYDWYILPVMNVDGYAYTFTDDRLWRKNRRQNAGSICVGTDLNRNFDWAWGNDGVSHLPCSDIFCGPSGGSEPETQAVSEELVRIGGSVLAMVTIHSYGNMWMFPWGNTVDYADEVCERADDHDDMMVVAEATANAIENTYGTVWSRGTSCEVIYATTGGTDDYAKGAAGIKYAFCPELRGSNFVINKNQITPSFNEIWAGVIAMVDTING